MMCCTSRRPSYGGVIGTLVSPRSDYPSTFLEVDNLNCPKLHLTRKSSLSNLSALSFTFFPITKVVVVDILAQCTHITKDEVPLDDEKDPNVIALPHSAGTHPYLVD